MCVCVSQLRRPALNAKDSHPVSNWLDVISSAGGGGVRGVGATLSNPGGTAVRTVAEGGVQ